MALLPTQMADTEMVLDGSFIDADWSLTLSTASTNGSSNGCRLEVVALNSYRDVTNTWPRSPFRVIAVVNLVEMSSASRLQSFVKPAMGFQRQAPCKRG